MGVTPDDMVDLGVALDRATEELRPQRASRAEKPRQGVGIGPSSQAQPLPMAGEPTHPILPCSDIDEAIAFYKALGFHQVSRQVRPNPYAVVALGDIVIHLARIDGPRPGDLGGERDHRGARRRTGDPPHSSQEGRRHWFQRLRRAG